MIYDTRKKNKSNEEMKMRILQLFSICFFEFPFHLFVIRNKFQFFSGFCSVCSVRSRDTGVHGVRTANYGS